MDLAVVTAAISLWFLAQAALLLARWLSASDLTELGWYGAGGVLLSLGTAMFGARYFGASYIITIAMANALILTGASMVVMGQFVSLGYSISIIPLTISGFIWVFAVQIELFQGSINARMWLSSLLTFGILLLAAVGLVRHGLQLSGVRAQFAAWCSLLFVILLKMFTVDQMSPIMFDKINGSIWNFIYAAALFVAASALVACLLRRSGVAGGRSAFTRELAAQLAGGRWAVPLASSTQSKPYLWTLRLDPLRGEGHSKAEFGARRVAPTILSFAPVHCPGYWSAKQAGPDKVVWLSSAGPERLEGLVKDLGNSPFWDFPSASISVGCTEFSTRRISTSIARSDRGAFTVMPGIGASFETATLSG